MKDDVSADVKHRRLQELTDLFYSLSSKRKHKYIDTHQLVLVEGVSKKSSKDLVGRADGNTRVVFPAEPLPSDISSDDESVLIPGQGDYVKVKVCTIMCILECVCVIFMLLQITDTSSITLRGSPVSRTNIKTYNNYC